jgi:hypothetical protein
VNAAIAQICSCTWSGEMRIKHGIDCPVHDPIDMKRRALLMERFAATESLTNLNHDMAMLPGRIKKAQQRLAAVNAQLQELNR